MDILPTLSHVGARGEKGRKEERYLYFGSGKRAKEGERIAVPVVSVVYGLGRQFTLVGWRLRGHRTDAAAAGESGGAEIEDRIE